jgi:hypothetical protein
MRLRLNCATASGRNLSSLATGESAAGDHEHIKHCSPIHSFPPMKAIN